MAKSLPPRLFQRPVADHRQKQGGDSLEQRVGQAVHLHLVVFLDVWCLGVF